AATSGCPSTTAACLATRSSRCRWKTCRRDGERGARAAAKRLRAELTGVMTGEVLLLDHVVKWRRSRGAAFCVRIERLALPRGGAYAAAGPSGCGKSTLLDVLALALRPDSCGAFVLSPADGDDLDIADAWDSGRERDLGTARRRHIGYVLQTGGLLSFLNVEDNIA